MISFQKIILPVLIISFFSACSQEKNTEILFERDGYHFPYLLAEPDQTWSLPGSLVEISGIGYIDESRLACIQDENGEIFIFNTIEGKIESQIVFGDNGDYEDIVILGNDAWILRSNGTLYELKEFAKNTAAVATKYPTLLSGKNDAEGLAYNAGMSSLLIACKEEPFTGNKPGEGLKAIYRFSIENRRLDPGPVYLISQDTIDHYKISRGIPGMGIPGYLKPGRTFKPSGLAIHPSTGYIYLLSAAGNLLMVLSKDGILMALAGLDPQIYPQPEGICFSPGGSLFISSEGAGRAGKIMKFEPVNVNP